MKNQLYVSRFCFWDNIKYYKWFCVEDRGRTNDVRHHEYCVERREGEEVGVQRDKEGIQKGHQEDSCRNTRDGGLKRDGEK